MRTLVLAILTVLSFSAFAAEEDACYQITSNAGVWSRTPESLCILENDNGKYTLTLKTGLGYEETTVATFNMNLLVRARCMECNMDEFGVANPSNSSLNALKIKFNGARHVLTHKEEGTVRIGKTKFYYRQR